MRGIDVHTHFVPENFLELPASVPAAGWPSMRAAEQCCHRHVMIDDKVYRTVSDQCWSAPKRISDMEVMNIGRQVLSPMPELLSYWLSAHDAQQLLRNLNEQIAAVVHGAPERFSGLGAVPLQDVDLAITELEYCARELGLSGVELGSNINGKLIGAPEFDPFFAAAAALDMAVFVHAIRPAGLERLVGPPSLEQVLAFPGEVGLSAASAITSNLLVRHPRLRLGFSHGGGALGLILPRLAHGASVLPPVRDMLLEAPHKQARKFFYDSLVYDAPTLRHLVDTFGAESMMLGTDYPFTIREQDPVGRLAEAGFDETTTDLLLHRNAARFLNREG